MGRRAPGHQPLLAQQPGTLDYDIREGAIESESYDEFREALDQIRSFPEDARQDAGFQIDKVQNGEAPA